MIIKKSCQEQCPTCGQCYGEPTPAIFGCDTCHVELNEETKVVVYFVPVGTPVGEYNEDRLVFCSHRCAFEYLNAHPFAEFAFDSYVSADSYADFVAAAAGEGEQL